MDKKNILLASTSTLYGGNYLEYLTNPITELFQGVTELLFIPFARPSGISHDEYTLKVSTFFETLSIKVNGLHTFQDKVSAIQNAKAIFTGGGNTFLLVKTLHEAHLMEVLKEKVTNGTPYLGCSAGSNIGGVNMMTTNDMPIVYPPSFETMAVVPFNINPHYLDPQPQVKHNGETRETRIKEFLVHNALPVVGLREGNWIRVKGGVIKVEGTEQTRIFLPGKLPYEVPPQTELVFL